jgi:hypothetical protein
MRIELVENYFRSKEFNQKFAHRLGTLEAVEENPILREQFLFNRWIVDPVEFIETFGVIFDPRLTQYPVIPFFLFDYQKEVVYRMLDAELRGQDLFIEKPRDMGLTWTFIWYILWRWLFTTNWACLLLSRKLEEVDKKGSPNCLFGKLRFAFYSLPPWLKPQNFKKRFHDNFAKFINPDMGSTIEGETDNPEATKGRRYSLIIFDEMFAMTYWEEIWSNTADTSKVRIGISTATPSFRAKTFRDLMEKKGQLISLSWKDNPFKDEIWYQQELERRKGDEIGIQSNIEVSYNIDPNLAYYPLIVKSKIKPVDYNPQLPLYVSLDFGAQDYSVILWWQYDGDYFYLLEGFQAKERRLEFYLPLLLPTYPLPYNWKLEYRLESWQKVLEKVRKWKKPQAYFGEIAHFQRVMPSNTSIAQELYRLSNGEIRLLKNNYGNTHEARKAAVDKILPITVFNSEGVFSMKCYDALCNTQYRKIRDTTTASEKALSKPVHTPIISDFRAAFENFAVNADKVAKKFWHLEKYKESATIEERYYDPIGKLFEQITKKTKR